MKSPLETAQGNLSGVGGNNAPPPKSKKKKVSSISVFKNPMFKEILPVGIFSLTSVALIGGLYFYTNSVEETTSLSSYDNIEKISSNQKQIELLMQQKGSLQAEIENSQSKINSMSLSLEEQNMMKTPLTQGYYFISYFSYLTEKYGIDLRELKVLASDGVSDIDLTNVAQSGGGFDLLPIKVKFITDTETLRSMLDEMYTKRIIQVRNLNMVNGMDGSINVEFQVHFTETELIMQQQEEVSNVIENDPNMIPQPVDPSQPTFGEDGQLIPNNQQQDSNQDNSATPPNTNSLNGTEVNNNNGNLTEEQIQQHYQDTGEIIDPVTGEVIK